MRSLSNRKSFSPSYCGVSQDRGESVRKQEMEEKGKLFLITSLGRRQGFMWERKWRQEIFHKLDRTGDGSSFFLWERGSERDGEGESERGWGLSGKIHGEWSYTDWGAAETLLWYWSSAEHTAMHNWTWILLTQAKKSFRALARKTAEFSFKEEMENSVIHFSSFIHSI